MDVQPIENSHPSNSSNDGVPGMDDTIAPQTADTNGSGDSENKLSAEEVKSVLEIIASTGKFWHDWDELKSMLSFQLKQVLSEYQEATKVDDQPNSSLRESCQDLVNKLEEALFSFTEGPPFTLQRLCEILLDARAIYPNLSKLALALEKNLLVTSMLTRSTDFYPPTMEQQPPDTQQEPIQDTHPSSPPPPQSPPPPPPPPHSNVVENGQEPSTGDKDDEVMTQADAQTDEGMAIDDETFQEMISSEPANNS